MKQKQFADIVYRLRLQKRPKFGTVRLQVDTLIVDQCVSWGLSDIFGEGSG